MAIPEEHRTGSDHRLTVEDLLPSPWGRSLVFGLAQRGHDDEFGAWAEPLTAEARALAELRSAACAAGSPVEKVQGSPRPSAAVRCGFGITAGTRIRAE